MAADIIWERRTMLIEPQQPNMIPSIFNAKPPWCGSGGEMMHEELEAMGHSLSQQSHVVTARRTGGCFGNGVSVRKVARRRQR